MDMEQAMRRMQEEMDELRRQLREQGQPPPIPPERPPIKSKYQHVAIPNAPSGPEVSANNFELKPALIRLVQQNTFGGRPTEDPNAHLTRFVQLCSTVKVSGASEAAIKFRLFPFSLRDDAGEWYDTVMEGGEDTWEGLARKFLEKYFPPGMTIRLKREINQFKQYETESLGDAWNRLKALLRRCPNHGLNKDDQIGLFYTGCTVESKMMLNLAANGSLLNRDTDVAWSVIEDLSNSDYETAEMQPKRVASVTDSDSVKLLTSQLAVLTSKLDTVIQIPPQITPQGSSLNLTMEEPMELKKSNADVRVEKLENSINSISGDVRRMEGMLQQLVNAINQPSPVNEICASQPTVPEDKSRL